MASKASISSGYRWRLGIIGTAAFAFGLYFLYDGYIGYPKKQEIFRKYNEFREGGAVDWTAKWTEHAEKQGWATEPPQDKSDMSIYTQYICAAISMPIGLLFLISFIRAGGRWIETNEGGLHTNGGQHADWAAVTSIDKSRWKSKGIAVVIYHDGRSRRRITLDDWKYERDPIAAMLAEVEAHLGSSKSQAPPGPQPGSAGEGNATTDESAGTSA